VNRFRNITIRFAKTWRYVQLIVCVRGNVQYFESYRALSAFIALLKIYNFQNSVHFLKRILQVVDNAVFWQNVLLYFKHDPLSLSF